MGGGYWFIPHGREGKWAWSRAFGIVEEGFCTWWRRCESWLGVHGFGTRQRPEMTLRRCGEWAIVLSGSKWPSRKCVEPSRGVMTQVPIPRRLMWRQGWSGYFTSNWFWPDWNCGHVSSRHVPHWGETCGEVVPAPLARGLVVLERKLVTFWRRARDHLSPCRNIMLQCNHSH